MIGALPLHLAALADEVIAIDMPNLAAERAGAPDPGRDGRSRRDDDPLHRPKR